MLSRTENVLRSATSRKTKNLAKSACGEIHAQDIPDALEHDAVQLQKQPNRKWIKIK